MVPKCEMFMSSSKNVLDICKKNMTAKHGILKGLEMWRNKYGLQIKISETLNLELHRYCRHECTVSVVISKIQKIKICLSNKEYESGHWW